MSSSLDVSSSTSKMWIEKYRPNQLSELMSHVEIIETIQRLIDGGKLPHLLLYGPPGTGKVCFPMMMINNNNID